MTEMTFEPFAPSDLAAWLVRARAGYIDERIAAGDTTAEAATNADASMDQAFPGGAPGPGQLVGRVISDGEPVGELWVGPQGDDPTRWWVWNIAVQSELQGRGYGRQAMLLVEQLARSHGATSVGLNVFAHNEVARRLYTSLGYAETSVQMRKDMSVRP